MEELDILNQGFGERFERLYDTFSSESQHSVRFQKGDKVTCEKDVRGTHTFSRKTGHLIQLALGFYEFDAAHEVCHALMSARGFPDTRLSGVYYEDHKINLLGITLRYSLTHQVVNKYLIEFGYSEEVSKFYAGKRAEIIKLLSAVSIYDLQKLSSIDYLGDGLSVLELSLADEVDDGIRQRLTNLMPQSLAIATELSTHLSSQSFETPQSFRSAYLVAVHWIDNFARTKAGMEKGMERELLISPVLSERLEKMPAADIFQLERQPLTQEFLTVLVKYLPDGGYCYSLAMSEKEAGEWEHRLVSMSAVAFVDFVDSLETRFAG